MKNKDIELEMHVPRVRTSDCKRLIFRLGQEPSWRDIDKDPDIYPVYPMPTLILDTYTTQDGQHLIHPRSYKTINDLVRDICKILTLPENSYLHTIIFYKSGIYTIKLETI